MKIKRIGKNIFHLKFRNQYDITSTLLRFQEHYESPKFRNKIFTLEEFMDWYAKKNGNFTYYEEWNGFNIPSYVLKPFLEGKFNPLTKKEKAFLRLFQNKKGKFYIIGTHGKSQKLLKHEIAHALFYVSPEYKKEMINCLDKLGSKQIEKQILELGYCRQVLRDEAQAYLIENSKKIKMPENPKAERIRRKMKKIFKKYREKLIS